MTFSPTVRESGPWVLLRSAANLTLSGERGQLTLVLMREGPLSSPQALTKAHVPWPNSPSSCRPPEQQPLQRQELQKAVCAAGRSGRVAALGRKVLAPRRRQAIDLVISPEDREYFDFKFSANVAILGIDVVAGRRSGPTRSKRPWPGVKPTSITWPFTTPARPCLADEWITKSSRRPRRAARRSWPFRLPAR